MVVRKIVQIDKDKCNGCGLCIPACHEGALQIVDGKAKLISDKYCDGLGDCLGECPQGAIEIIEREADEYDEESVQARMAEMKKKEKKEKGIYLDCGCFGSGTMNFVEDDRAQDDGKDAGKVELKSQLKQWPVQITLVPPDAPYFEDASLLLCADCVPFAYPNLHSGLMKDKTVLVGCPKLDDAEHYIEKLAAIFKLNSIKDITIVRMEVSCCGGLNVIVDRALEMAGKNIPVNGLIIGIKGNIK